MRATDGERAGEPSAARSGRWWLPKQVGECLTGAALGPWPFLATGWSRDGCLYVRILARKISLSHFSSPIEGFVRSNS